METAVISEKKKSRNTLVTILIVAGMLVTVIINLLSLVNCWSMIEYAEWEFEPFRHEPSIAELHRSVFFFYMAKMCVTIASTVCIIIFLIKLLRWKKHGFWGFAITSVAAMSIHVTMSILIMRAFHEIDVNLSYILIPFQIVWTLATIAILYAILQIRKNGVSCWKQLE